MEDTIHISRYFRNHLPFVTSANQTRDMISIISLGNYCNSVSRRGTLVILAFVFLHVCMCVYVYMNVWTNLKGVGERKYACDVRILCINYSK